ncbi:uncharacterized protein [Henckelia pumila]|uniref:uncharacterized protein n=1 Tax=Henckelia pumila TaxID=405737 RepID=UPI003C6E8C5A
MTSCPLPENFDMDAVKKKIELSLQQLNYSGPISIYAYGKLTRMKKKVVKKLGEICTEINDIEGPKDSAEMRIRVDILDMMMDKTDTPNRMLISGNEELASALHILKYENYNILLGAPELQFFSSLSAPQLRKTEGLRFVSKGQRCRVFYSETRELEH